jgi:D-ribose pyranase
LIATLGHGDAVVIGDAGLPVPQGTRCIDLALTRGVPSFMQVLNAVLSEMAVERAQIADELLEANLPRADDIRRSLKDAEMTLLPHADFKQLTAGARAVIRTGECTPYCNVILYSGVAFGALAGAGHQDQ